MHTQVLDAEVVDHADGNGLNNQRHNLRAATLGQNVVNSKKRKDGVTSPYKGVYWNEGNQKWMTRVAGKYIGYFESEVDAAKAYDKAARARYGVCAHLNFPEDF